MPFVILIHYFKFNRIKINFKKIEIPEPALHALKGEGNGNRERKERRGRLLQRNFFVCFLIFFFRFFITAN